MKDTNTEIWSFGGGTVTPQHIGESLIHDLFQRLLWLNKLIEEEQQGK